ncbi:MAG: acyltransferase [Minicystis sp.]
MSGNERLRSLDGIRAVSVALVILAHAAKALGVTLRFDTGKLGVQMFFVLSGFLITTLLAREQAKTGRISLASFYWRRTMRIFPPFYVFLLVVLGLSLAGVLTVPWSDMIYAATYTMNYARDRVWTLGHTWSLAVEEQFYLVWPAILVLLGIRRGLSFAVAVMVIVPVLRVLSFRLFPATHDGIGETFPTAADALAAGCALALGRDRLWQWAPYRRLIASRFFFLVPVLGVILHAQSHHAQFAFLVGYGAVAVVVALCIDHVLRFPEGAASRFLTLRPMTLVGVTSYSIYIWQQPFFDVNAKAWWTATPIGMVLLVICVIASYQLVEKPSMRLRLYIESRRRREPPPEPRLAA